MAGVHEHMEHAEHAQHAAHSNKKIALLISVLALFLALSETLGKSAQTEALSLNIHASDTWNFFQAKTIRQTTLRVAAEGLAVQAAAESNPQTRAAIAKQIETWQKTVARYESDPEQKDGRKELRALAEQYEHERNTALARYHHYEIASAVYQIGIVLASAAVITGIVALAYGAAGLGVIGVVFLGIGLFAPEAVHFV
ncbi:MAG TPA: DUF4337 domain-containing protein [Xanthobacteraceae bacterium]|nr:DUF4337 domain-containing protein [Xanthobacteraceae bacterium]